MTETKRPFEITTLAIIIVLLGIVKLLSYAMLLFVPGVQEFLIYLSIHESDNALLQFPLLVHYLISGISTTLYLVSGIGLLFAQHWARLVLAIWPVCILLFSFLTTGSFSYMMIKIPFFIIMLIVLFSPRVKTYFNAG